MIRFLKTVGVWLLVLIVFIIEDQVGADPYVGLDPLVAGLVIGIIKTLPVALGFWLSIRIWRRSRSPIQQDNGRSSAPESEKPRGSASWHGDTSRGRDNSERSSYEYETYSSDLNSSTTSDKSDDEKECPKCAETIKAQALICRFCRYNFETDTFETR